MEILGIDIGGSGVKGAPVDVEKGVLLADELLPPVDFASVGSTSSAKVSSVTDSPAPFSLTSVVILYLLVF